MMIICQNFINSLLLLMGRLALIGARYVDLGGPIVQHVVHHVVIYAFEA